MKRRLNEPCTLKRVLDKSTPNEGGEMKKIVRNKSGPLSSGSEGGS